MNGNMKITFIICIFVLAIWTNPLIAGTIVEEFNSKNVNEDLWEVKSVGKASYEIKDGKIILSSPKPTDGIILYYKEEIKDEEIIFEVKTDPSGIVNSGYITFMKINTPPEVSNVYNPLRLAQFRLKSDNYRVRDENIQTVVDGNFGTGMHVFKVEVVENGINFYFEGKLVAEKVKKIAKTRFFAVSPDPYSDDYQGTISIEYVKISGPDIMAVNGIGELACSWGEIKRGY